HAVRLEVRLHLRNLLGGTAEAQMAGTMRAVRRNRQLRSHRKRLGRLDRIEEKQYALAATEEGVAIFGPGYAFEAHHAAIEGLGLVQVIEIEGGFENAGRSHAYAIAIFCRLTRRLMPFFASAISAENSSSVKGSPSA